MGFSTPRLAITGVRRVLCHGLRGNSLGQKCLVGG